MHTHDARNLKKRYLLWLYKTTKKSLDRIERKFTQLEIDRFILGYLKKLDRQKRAGGFIFDFKTYIANKEREALNLKYEGKNLKSEYYFLDLKLAAIEKVITQELGKKALLEIKSLYEREMTERILKSKDDNR
jgi:hypothetical protein